MLLFNSKAFLLQQKLCDATVNFISVPKFTAASRGPLCDSMASCKDFWQKYSWHNWPSKAIQIPTSPKLCFYTTWGKQSKRNMHWNEQQTSINWRLDRTKIWSRWSELMKYIVYLLTIVLPVKQRTVTRLADNTVSAEQCTNASGDRNDRTVSARNPRFHLSGSVAPNSPDLNLVYYKLWGSFNRGSVRRRSRMWMNSRSDNLWIGLEQNTIDTASNEWRNRLGACVCAKGRHFEHLL